MLPLKDEKAPLKFPPTVLFLLFLNFYLFLNGKFGNYGHSLTPENGFVPSQLFENPFAHAPTILISLFIHTGWSHLIGNMLFLWVFGNRLEALIKPVKFLILYLTCGVLSLIGFAFLSEIKDIPIVGASGSISGILGAYLILFPKARIVTLFFWIVYINILKTPAFVYIFFWVTWQFFEFISNFKSISHVAWLGHLIGFAAGTITIFFLTNRKDKQETLKNS
jgi:membrane associated rhomboid family serine protease